MVCSSSITSLSPTRYAELRARVLSLQRSYLSIKARHSYHQTLHGLLSKLDVRGVQETIPSRDSAVVKELERTKMLDAKRFKSSDTIGTPSMTRITGDQLQTIRDIVGAVVPRPTSMSYPQTASTSVSVYDPKYMLEALSIAQEAYDNGEVPVGCVFVHHGEIIARGRNRPNETLNGTRHAEIEGIDQILASGKHVADDFQRCDLYVTVEPCVMCASALRQIRIRKVYFGCANERFGGNGSVLGINDTSPALTTTTSSPYASEGGFYREEAIILLRKFYIRENENAPVPKKKTNRVLKTDITPVAESVSPGGGTIDQA
ncbi:cytidine deaminase-like protein [Jimgerdemannia flammicorona]|uniref:tRNA(adenine(34)) deaminase n=1 Tax=Jimgerdemannia flammicorona TaxID=994334 RepID=A0A433BA32_9FUNG|nr:cytidine deaminase-like protein [Jimgerdemannia flammicorona]